MRAYRKTALEEGLTPLTSKSSTVAERVEFIMRLMEMNNPDKVMDNILSLAKKISASKDDVED